VIALCLKNITIDSEKNTFQKEWRAVVYCLEMGKINKKADPEK
jgi:hypothetical protein